MRYALVRPGRANSDPPAALIATVAAQSARPVAPALHRLCERMIARFGAAVAGVIFYGSCLRSGQPRAGMVDLYIVVDRYAAVYESRLLCWLNALLPPNVFYHESADADGAPLRAKCAVLSLQDLELGTAQWFHSYLWGRFAQPVRLVYARDDLTRGRIERALASAVVTLLERTLPCLPERFDSAECWQRALALSYTAELRPESPQRAAELVYHDLPDYRRRIAAAVVGLPGMTAVGEGDWYINRMSARGHFSPNWRWLVRRGQGRMLTVLRLMKSALTFENGVDYLAWKLERHTGVALELTECQRRYPLLFGWSVLWRLLRQGSLR
ncbi:MAG: hypothetical protein J5I81_05615 [Nitrococcus mobilis]|nr:hypothetical protein [Nitrococcus mobilis]